RRRTMDNTNLPPIPDRVDDPQSCATVRLYLAVLDDLPPEQVQALYQHIDNCPACAAELRLLNQVTRLVADFAERSETAPSAHVDQAVMSALAARNIEPIPVLATVQRRAMRKPKNPLWRLGQIAVAAVLLLSALTAVYFHSQTAQAFAIPGNVSWSGYVLYHSETVVGSHGVQCHVESYHDMNTNRMHVETTVADQLDVVAVSDGQTILGMDMMHHVVQWGANDWSVDDSLFDLAALRSDLQSHRAVYLGKDHFQSQDVYRIRARNGLILLLNMHYMPVNVLHSSTGEPMYDALSWLRPTQVSSSMWDMSMPPGFQMGTLPARP
ncbi:MAG TPA: hypothetical protein VFN02_15680, partial [Ktedonobacteraceae bacterium]|nr:hypothetical protein [Ktedonobacteraceae bacterium]